MKNSKEFCFAVVRQYICSSSLGLGMKVA